MRRVWSWAIILVALALAGRLGVAAAQAVPNLKRVPPAQEVEGVWYCHQEYRVTLKDGSVQRFAEFDLRLKIDSGPNGPESGRAALVQSGRIGDRGTVVVAGLTDLKRLVRERCADVDTPVRLYAAGSLRGPLTEIARVFTAIRGIPVALEFGASGLLRQRLERGEPADVFASANLEHPRALAGQGKATPVVVFARNELCALARPGLAVTRDTLLERMLDPAVKLGTSTPKADPSGDYAWEVFRRADAIRPGSRETLERKALQLTGGPASPAPPTDRGVYAELVGRGAADLFLTYCTNAAGARAEVPALQIVALPASLAVGAQYGLTVLEGGDVERGVRLATFILSPEGQDILFRHGFTAPARSGD